MEKMSSKNYSVGIDIGSVSLNCIVINWKKEIVFESAYKRHFGKIKTPNQAFQDPSSRVFQNLD